MDWDSISDATPPDDMTDPSDAVSTPQLRRRKRGQSREVSLSRHFILLGLAGLVIASLASGITWLIIYRVSGIHTANPIATVTTEPQATAATEQQIYTQATSGTPAVDDPLSDDRNNWGVFTTDWGGQCAFTGGAYHLTLSKQGYVLWCNSDVVSNLNNFTLQVRITVVQGDYSSIVFGQNANGAYSIDIHSNGAYGLYRQLPNNQPADKLRYGLSSAIKQGLNQTNIITISVNNNQFYFYANKQLLTSDYLSDYVPGGVELAAVSFDQASTDIAYSNLKVWTL